MIGFDSFCYMKKWNELHVILLLNVYYNPILKKIPGSPSHINKILLVTDDYMFQSRICGIYPGLCFIYSHTTYIEND